jgi:thymidylate synthase
MKIDKNTLKLCYLFLSLNKAISKDNLLRFNEIARNSNLPQSAQEEIISNCEKLIEASLSERNRFTVIFEAIKEITRPNESSVLSFSPLSNRSGQRECLWLLECLSWQAGTSAENEREIIRSLAVQWKIDEAMILEMEDTARTLYEIDSYRSFLKNTNEHYDTINALLQELDKSQSEIIGNMFETINI